MYVTHGNSCYLVRNIAEQGSAPGTAKQNETEEACAQRVVTRR